MQNTDNNNDKSSAVTRVEAPNGIERYETQKSDYSRKAAYTAYGETAKGADGTTAAKINQSAEKKDVRKTDGKETDKKASAKRAAADFRKRYFEFYDDVKTNIKEDW